MVKSM
jgi:hypothetical protein